MGEPNDWDGMRRDMEDMTLQMRRDIYCICLAAARKWPLDRGFALMLAKAKVELLIEELNHRG